MNQSMLVSYRSLGPKYQTCAPDSWAQLTTLGINMALGPSWSLYEGWVISPLVLKGTLARPGRPRKDTYDKHHPYLTNEDGGPLLQEKVDRISKDARSHIETLKLCGRDVVPATWGKASSYIRTWLAAKLYPVHPELAYCDDDYKLNEYMSRHYNGWVTGLFPADTGLELAAEAPTIPTPTIPAPTFPAPTVPAPAINEEVRRPTKKRKVNKIASDGSDLDDPSLFMMNIDTDVEIAHTIAEDVAMIQDKVPSAVEKGKGREVEVKKKLLLTNPLRVAQAVEIDVDSDGTIDDNEHGVDNGILDALPTKASTSTAPLLESVLPTAPTCPKSTKKVTRKVKLAGDPTASTVTSSSNSKTPAPRRAPVVRKPPPTSTRSTRSKAAESAVPPESITQPADTVKKASKKRGGKLKDVVTSPNAGQGPPLDTNPNSGVIGLPVDAKLLESAKMLFTLGYFYQTNDDSNEVAEKKWAELTEEQRRLWAEKARKAPQLPTPIAKCETITSNAEVCPDFPLGVTGRADNITINNLKMNPPRSRPGAILIVSPSQGLSLPRPSQLAEAT
ncbi:hypothetical protein BDN72DRAFT_902054 [Pluteus cervinus]|uniref:Uncharacterized protein n=1 Tax=Pluteus cervinus TaxID=181527 RepID=A0ACD3AE93_9AGAR|nr:hypothetical protein BDN72DRAFT_902054 [Pluteus cervinus]